MTAPCPDWRALTDHRRDPRAAEPAGWDEALEHFDRCGRCRPAALAADPSLLFRRLREAGPESAGLGGDVDVATIAAIRQGVATLRAARRLDADHRRSRSPWGRWAAAAALAIGTLSAGSVGSNRTTGSEDAWRAEQGEIVLLGKAAAVADVVDDIQPVRGQVMRPVIEGLNRPDARLYQMQDGELSVAMIVDEGLEI